MVDGPFKLEKPASAVSSSMPCFYHVQRAGVAPFRVGKTYQFGAQQNFFMRDLLNTSMAIHVAGVGEAPVDFLVRDYLDESGFRHYRHIRSGAVTPDEKGLLGAALSVLGHQAMIIREFVFEDVRRQSFNEKPSRFKGIWLIPHNEQVLAHWCATAPQGQFRAFEVEATGRFHHGLSRHLKPECVGVADILKKAQRYWSEPADVLAEPAEILCEGEIKILRQLEVAGSETTVWRKLKNLF